ncbi:MAG: extracellular solute-binding protein [Lachnospiraceae bacterium]|nr:extracellular solute-binding protein [Lachnospiraceae bacterium]
MKKNRIMAAALSGAMAVSMLTGCGGTNSMAPKETNVKAEAGNTGETTGAAAEAEASVTPAGEFPIVKEPLTLTVAAIDETYVGALGDVDFIKWYEEKTGIHIEWNEIPRDGYKEKLNLMLSTGNLPDIILGMKVTSNDVTSYGEDGTFVMLDDYIEKYGVEFKKILAETPEIKEHITSPDGHIYSLPSFNDCLHNQYRTRAWINTEWLDAVGMEMPTTTEEFEAVLQAFKDQDPNGNGIADEIPMLANSSQKNNIVNYLMNAFIYMNGSDVQDPSTYYLYLDENDKIQFTPDKEQYKEGLKWINSLVEKGLIDSTSFTLDETQLKQIVQDGEAPKVGVIRADIITTYLSDYNGTADHRISQYRALEPLTGPEGFKYQPSYLYASTAPGNFIITSSCENPEAAFRWADGWYSEEASFMAWYGQEGKGWTQPPEGSMAMNGEKAMYQRLNVEGAEQTIRITNKFGNNTAKLRESEVYLEDDPAQRFSTEPILYFAVKESLEPYADHDRVVPPLNLTREEASEISNIRTMIDDYVEENQALFSLGTRDIEKEWDAYVGEFEALGLDKMLEVYQTAYERQYK